MQGREILGFTSGRELLVTFSEVRWNFFNGLPLLPRQTTSLLDKPVTLLELYDAVLCMKSDKVPGIDGLSYNFYKNILEYFM